MAESIKKTATRRRRQLICKTTHELEIFSSKTDINKILSIIFKVSTSTIREIHKQYCTIRTI